MFYCFTSLGREMPEASQAHIVSISVNDILENENISVVRMIYATLRAHLLLFQCWKPVRAATTDRSIVINKKAAQQFSSSKIIEKSKHSVA